MPKIDFWYIIIPPIVAINAVAMFTQAGIFGIICGIIWVSVWGVLGYWDWQNHRRKRIEQELAGLEIIGVNLTPEELAEAVNRVKPDLIGDRTCKSNAQSPYIRCAVNPCGPCEGCREYEQ